MTNSEHTDGSDHVELGEYVTRCIAGIERLEELFEQPSLEPDIERSDWSVHRPDVDEAIQCLQTEILGPLPDAKAEIDDEELREALVGKAAVLSVQTAALLVASGSTSEGISLLQTALGLLSTEEARLEVAAGLKDPKAYTRLMHARWLMRQGDAGRATKAAKRVLETATEQTLRAKAQALLDGPKPLSSAPALFRFNGFGMGLYGARDHHEDGSYVATHCLSAVWVPVFPLAAYRVLEQGEDGYLFLSKEPLSSFARACRSLVLAGVLVAAVFWGVDSYRHSPSYLAGVALEQAEKLEAAGDREAAIVALETSLTEYGDEPSAALERVATKLVDLYCAEVPDKITAAHAQHAARVVGRFRALPPAAQRGTAADQLVARIGVWSAMLGTSEPAKAFGALHLLQLADEVGNEKSFTQRRRDLQMKLAASREGTWPLQALDLYLDHGGSDARDRAGALLVELGDHPWLLLDAEMSVTRWLNNAKGEAGLAKAVTRIENSLERARREATLPKTQRVLEAKKLQPLSRMARKRPHDQRIAVALAEMYQTRGRLDQALATLTALGEPGWTTREAQRLRASLHNQRGEIEEAETLLESYLATRLPAAQAARRAYVDRVETLQRRLVSRAQRGDLPDELHRKLNGASEEEQPEIFHRWMAEQIEADTKANELEAARADFADVAPVCLSLGMVKVRRARDASGPLQQHLLRQAEQVFLAIRDEAQGLPTFHLGLGQVFYRLGRAGEGEKEFNAVIEHGDPELAVAVASAYRELGMVERAQKVAEGVWNAGGPAGQEAAVLLSLMSTTLEDEEMWLERSDQSSPFVRANLRQVRARRLFREGKAMEADRLMAEVAGEYEKEAAHSSTAANNAALAEQFRFACSGDVDRLVDATNGLEAALRMEPDSSLIVGNLAGAHDHLGMVRVLAQWLDVEIVTPTAGDAGALLRAMVLGPLKDQLIAATRKDASLRRSIELSRQEQVLAPTRPSGYERELSWHVLREDSDELSELHRRIVGQQALDTSANTKARDDYVNGTYDERVLERLDSAIARLDRNLRKAKQRRATPTIAAIHFLRGTALMVRAEVRRETADAEAAVAAFRRARDTWPPIGATAALRWALVNVAIMKAAKSFPPLAAKWNEEVRQYDQAMLLVRISASDEMTAAIRQQRELGEAMKLPRRATVPLGLGDWALGIVAADPAMAGKALMAFRRKDEKLEREIAARLNPSPNTEAALRLLQQHASE